MLIGIDAVRCIGCRACVDACPTSAITMPLLPKKRAAEAARVLPADERDAGDIDVAQP